MKKFFLIAAAAAMVLSSCSKNNVSDNTTKANQIGFGVYAGRTLTKADATFIPKGQTWLPAGSHFGVYCYSTTATEFKTVAATAKANYMANVDVHFDVTSADASIAQTSGNYKYTDTKYWPKDGNGIKLAFYAYYPFDCSAVSTIPDGTTAGLGSFEYTTPSTSATQPDFMLSEVVADQTYSSHSGNVPLVFHHVLSQIQVAAKIDDETNRNVTVKITGIVFNGLNDHGTVTESYDGTTTYKWGTTDGSATYDVSPDSPITLGTTSTDCTSDGKTILTVPQKFSDGATVTITYTVSGNGGPDVPVTVTIPLKDIVAQQGKTTNFDLTFSLFDTTKPITFTASVIDWEVVNKPETI
jgi:hypothetical protein